MHTPTAVRAYAWWRTVLRADPLGGDALLMALAGVALWGVVLVVGQWAGLESGPTTVDLSPAALPYYTLLSLSRGLLAYALSLAFTLVYGFWAAKHRPSGRLLVPLLDILQSIPVLGFMPGVVLALIALFPQRNLGLELAAVAMIFTGQVWNMTFSWYRSLTSLPRDQDEAARAFRFSWWRRLRRVELPAATCGLVWNSMMSMAGGWFFLMLSETFTLGTQDFRLPGLGSYMQEALNRGAWSAMAWGVLAMVAMIVLLDQLLWRPLVVWAERFRVEDSAAAEAQESWFLTLLHRSRLLAALRRWRTRPPRARAPEHAHPADGRSAPEAHRVGAVIAWLGFSALLAALLVGGWQLWLLLRQVPWAAPAGDAHVSWLAILGGTGLTAARVLGAVLLGTLWALPAGLAIGRSPRWSRRLQPVIQVAASFPAPMLFPLCLMAFHLVGLPLGVGSMLLMLLGTQWYILFNVVAGAQAIPSDLREATAAFRLTPWRRFTTLEAPAVFPALVTGWVTAAGGAWNAAIVAEYLQWDGAVQRVSGLGATISVAAGGADYPGLAAAVCGMALTVVIINLLCWRPLQRLAQGRFALA